MKNSNIIISDYPKILSPKVKDSTILSQNNRSSEKCFAIITHCAVTIKTGSCTEGMCSMNVVLSKRIIVHEHANNCEDCPKTHTSHITRNSSRCGPSLFFWSGSQEEIKCINTWFVCETYPGSLQPSDDYQSLDFNCGFVSDDTSERQTEIAKKLEECLESISDGSSDPADCGKLCDITSITNPPGGGTGAGSGGGIGSKQDCKDECGRTVFLGWLIWKACVELCESKRSEKLLDELEEWIDANC